MRCSFVLTPGQLKKLIKNVVSELSTMGLSPQVLQKLLVTEEDEGSSLPGQPHRTRSTSPHSPGPSLTPDSDKHEDDEEFEFEFESPENSPDMLGNHLARQSMREVIVDPIDEIEESHGVHSAYEPSSLGTSPHSHHRKFRLRLLSETTQAQADGTGKDGSSEKRIRPVGVGEMIQAQRASQAQTQIPAASTKAADGGRLGPGRRRPSHGRRVVRASSGNQGVKAAYVLAGE
jgi:hypothetical protein